MIISDATPDLQHSHKITHESAISRAIDNLQIISDHALSNQKWVLQPRRAVNADKTLAQEKLSHWDTSVDLIFDSSMLNNLYG